MTKRRIQYWVIPPEANAEFVACMEDVLDTYAQPYDASHPVICMDERIMVFRDVLPSRKPCCTKCGVGIWQILGLFWCNGGQSGGGIDDLMANCG